MSTKNMTEKDDGCLCYSESLGTKSCPPVRNVTHPLRYYEFTKEEMKALEECDVESFYRRCLPFSTIFATMTYAAIKFGFVKRNPHFGVVPKVMLAMLVGHILGRLTFTPTCEKKLLKLPANSHLGNTMRRYRKEREEVQKT